MMTMRKLLAALLVLCMAAMLCAFAEHANPEATVQVGGVTVFGSYEQDNDPDNGAEPIEWIVLEYDAASGQALLLSRYGLDAKSFHYGEEYPTWERSNIRAWLNGEFLNAAFTAEEQKAIAAANITTPDFGGSDGGADTQDRVWLLSREEAEKYFGSDEARRTVPTAYAAANGALRYEGDDGRGYLNGEGCSWWWLRSPGDLGIGAADVDFGGSLSYVGVGSTYGCVRPAIRLNPGA